MKWHAPSAFLNTIKDIRAHSATSFFTAAILSLPVLVGQAGWVLPGPAGFATGISFSIVGAFTSGLWLPVAMTIATRRYATGNDPGVGGVLAQSAKARLLWRYFAASFLVAIIIIGIGVVLLVPAAGAFFAALSGAGGRINQVFEGGVGAVLIIALALGLLAWIPLAIIFSLRYALARPVSVLEDVAPSRALRRSRALCKGRWADVFVLWLIIFGISSAVGLILGGPSIILSFRDLGSMTQAPPSLGPGDLFGYPLGRPGVEGVAEAMVYGISAYLTQVALQPFSAGMLANFYLGVRSEQPYESPPPALLSGQSGGPPPHGQAHPSQEQQSAGEDQGPWDLPEEPSGD